MQWKTIFAIVVAAIKSAWTGGSPFAVQTVLYPLNDDGKYVIQSEGIRLAFTLNGGALSNLWMNDTNGVERDIVLGFDQAKEYLSYGGTPWLNGVIGRVAGVMAGTTFEMDGVPYDVASDGKVETMTFNGGDRGWGRRTLDVASHSENAVTFVVFDRSWGGFPGKPAGCITHLVTPYEWHIALGLVPVRMPTPVSLSQQVFWNLDGFAPNSSHNVLNHRLRLPFSGMRFGVDKDDIPTGEIKPNTKDSTYDFWSESRRIGDVIHKEGPHYRRLDETYMVSRAQPWKFEDNPIAELASDLSGIQVKLFTNQEALKVHTWDSTAEPVALKRDQGRGKVPHHGAISMEMQNWPDAIHHPEWHRENEAILEVDKIYGNYATFKFSLNNQN